MEESDLHLVVEVPGLLAAWILSLFLAGLDLQMVLHPLLPPRVSCTSFHFLSASKPQDMVVHIPRCISHMWGNPNQYRSRTYCQPGRLPFSC